VVGYLAGGVPYFAPIGELVRDAEEDRVQCHLCGGWFRLVAGAHLSRVHGWTAAEYRDALRLLSTEPTCSRELSARQRDHGRRRVACGEPPVGARLERDAIRAIYARHRFPRWRSLGALHPELMPELHPSRNGELDPFAVAASSHRKLWWRCQDGHEWLACVYNRSAGTGCPICARVRAKASGGSGRLPSAHRRSSHSFIRG
jgi:ribosomal protein S27E